MDITHNLNALELGSAVWRHLNGFDTSPQQVGHGRVGAVTRVIVFEGPNWLDLLEGIIVGYGFVSCLVSQCSERVAHAGSRGTEGHLWRWQRPRQGLQGPRGLWQSFWRLLGLELARSILHRGNYLRRPLLAQLTL